MKRLLEKLPKDWRPFSETDWYLVSSWFELPQSFIDRHRYKLDWYQVCKCQNLSEKFMEKNTDKIYWATASLYQKMSKDFILRNQDKISFDDLIFNEKITRKVIKEACIETGNKNLLIFTKRLFFREKNIWI